LAILDAAGKFFGETAAVVLGRKVVSGDLHHTGGVPLGETDEVERFLKMIKEWEFDLVKVKVGRGDDVARMRRVREVLGEEVRLGIDANNAWSDAAAAIPEIEKLSEFGLEFVEQPTPEVDEMAKIAAAVPVPVMPDESLVALRDAEEFIAKKAAGMFNIRVSKCGGIANSLRISDLARESGVPVYVGAQIGETNILAAAGRIFASMLEKIEGLEGGGERLIFPEELVLEDLTFGKHGLAHPPRGDGLGVHPIEGNLKKYFVRSKVLGG
jgi:muconate cycloisomerase